MLRSLCTAVILCICGTGLFAQAEINPPPLSMVPNTYYVSFVQPISDCCCVKKDSTPKKQGSVFSLDVPVASSWEMIDEDRIKKHTIQSGGSMPLWVKTAKSDKWPVPRIIFSTPNFMVKAEGGVAKVSTPSPRTMAQADMATERSVWFVLVGASGFFGQEQVSEIEKGVNFSADFRRRSGGGQGWLGIKFGDFNRNFIAGRYGKGYVYTDGADQFNVPGVDGLDWLPVYIEEFKTELASVEGKTRTRWISQSVRVDWVKYNRVNLSPDPLRFGENYLEDMWLRTETEITPFSKINFLRGVVVLTKDFGDKNRLMFFNDYSSVRFFVRLTFD